MVSRSGSEPTIVFLTVHEDPDFIEEALEVGALGYVIKEMALDLISRNTRCAGWPGICFSWLQLTLLKRS